MFATSVGGFLALLPLILIIYRAYSREKKRKMAYKLKILERKGYISEGTVEAAMRFMN